MFVGEKMHVQYFRREAEETGRNEIDSIIYYSSTLYIVVNEH